MKYIITEETINKILNYLATQKYLDVAGLINEIQTKVEKIEPTEKVE